MLIFACRRRRHAKATKVIVSNFPGAGGHPQTFPSWQEAQQTPFGPGATSTGWSYPTQSAARPDQVKSTASPDQAQRTTPSEQMPSTAPFGEALRTPPSDQVQRPALTSQVLSTATPGLVQRVAPPGQAQSTAFSGEWQSSTPSSQVQGTAPLVRTQEQGAPPPRHAYAKATPSAGEANGRDQSPPPYYPVSQEKKLCRVLHGWSHALTTAFFEADPPKCTYRALGKCFCERGVEALTHVSCIFRT